MEVIKARNVNSAYTQGLALLRAQGMRETSRAGDVLVIQCPVTTVYERPQERVLFDPVRDANPLFHIFEALWMLAGRRDARWLDRFVKDFSSRFAEDDGLQHGSYGFRWRHHFDVEGGGAPGLPDQLDTVVRLLQENPQDRRVVLTMWDPVADLGVNKRDLPCLAGDTPLWSPEGDLAIAEVAEKFTAGVTRWPIYSVDPETWTLRLTWCTSVWKSGYRRVYRLRFDDGSELRATADHILYRRAGAKGYAAVHKSEQVRVSDLKVGDRLLATFRMFGGKGYEKVKRALGKNTAYSNRQAVHVEYWKLLNGDVPEGCVIHQDNDVKTDNRESNLLCWTKSEHDSYHRRGDRNPMRNLTPAQHKARATKQAQSLRNWWASKSTQERSQIARGEYRDNHIIVSIEECGFEDVYDFTVPDSHTALIGTGIVAHNCNTQAYLRLRLPSWNQARVRWQELGAKESERDAVYDCPVLDLTVCCRSNDAIWGAYGANAVHFSVLHEYLAGRIGVGVGQYFQVSNNFHAYVDTLEKVGEPSRKWGEPYGKLLLATDQECRATPMGQDWARWDEDLGLFFGWTEAIEMEGPSSVGPHGYTNDWFSQTVEPLYAAHWLWRKGQRDHALEIVQDKAIWPRMAPDWRCAVKQWFVRRLKPASTEDAEMIR